VSWQAARAVLDMRGLDPTAKWVLAAIGLRAGDDGRAWPSVARICEDTGYGRSAVRRAVGRLVDSGYLTVIHKRGAVSVYATPPPKNPTPPPKNPHPSAKEPQKRTRREHEEGNGRLDREAAGRRPGEKRDLTREHEELRRVRDAAARRCPRCDEIGWIEASGRWCDHAVAD
jgi:DNA-binding transcriptional MocR family regulator